MIRGYERARTVSSTATCAELNASTPSSSYLSAPRGAVSGAFATAVALAARGGALAALAIDSAAGGPAGTRLFGRARRHRRGL